MHNLRASSTIRSGNHIYRFSTLYYRKAVDPTVATCKGCGREFNWTEEWCPDCYWEFQSILDNPPQQLIELLGEENLGLLDYDRDFLPLVAIEKQAADGIISKEEAKRKKNIELERIRKQYNPTREEFDDEMRRRAEARGEKSSFYDTLFN